jgi:hypothetical protein
MASASPPRSPYRAASFSTAAEDHGATDTNFMMSRSSTSSDFTPSTYDAIHCPSYVDQSTQVQRAAELGYPPGQR